MKSRRNSWTLPQLEELEPCPTGIYMLTLYAKNFANLFADAAPCGASPVPALTDPGQAAQDAIDYLDARTEGLSVWHSAILPDRVQLLLCLPEPGTPDARRVPQDALGRFARSLVRFSNRTLGRELWHGVCHGRCIQDEEELSACWEQMDSNPLQEQTCCHE